ncbi:hypothetical protein K2P97_00495 [bacterium]|nr:hypothetical protein [bacterium]
MNAFIFFTATLLSALLAFAHGEDKPGPHGGHIKMPANFHTEVIADKDGSFHIYLLDMQFKNPTVKSSEIKAYVLSGKKKTTLKCSVMGEKHFHCKSSKAVKSASSLVIKAKREGTWASMDAKYNLPLKEFQQATSDLPTDKKADIHSSH